MSIDAKPSAPLNLRPQTFSVAAAIRRAAQETGANFEYLLATAKVESNLNPTLKARGSSATGLFQFIEQTWLAMIKQAGAALGLGRYAAAITQTASGRYQVSDPALRSEILQLRKNATANAAMAGIFTQHNATALGKRIGRVPSEGELYMAHFFGAGGAAALINAATADPHANAAARFPAAARANHSIFYDRQGRPRTVAGVYAELNRRYQVARASTLPAAIALKRTADSPVAPDTAATTRALALASAVDAISPAPASVPAVRPGEPIFRSLFLATEARGPVAPVVAQLWAKPVVPGRGDSAAPLDLFQDMPPSARALFRGSA